MTSQSDPHFQNLGWVSGKQRDLKAESTKLLEILDAKLKSGIVHSGIDLSDAFIVIKRDQGLPVFTALKNEVELGFDFFVDLTVTDWLDEKEDRFEVVYHLMSTTHGYRLRVKVAVPEGSPEVNSVTPLWAGANFMEREAWDMYGVVFKGHPDLRRILMYPEFKGHPLRKDYPLQGKQPRVQLRAPEVTNTARNMIRPELVAINSRRKD